MNLQILGTSSTQGICWDLELVKSPISGRLNLGAQDFNLLSARNPLKLLLILLVLTDKVFD